MNVKEKRREAQNINVGEDGSSFIHSPASCRISERSTKYALPAANSRSRWRNGEGILLSRSREGSFLSNLGDSPECYYVAVHALDRFVTMSKSETDAVAIHHGFRHDQSTQNSPLSLSKRKKHGSAVSCCVKNTDTDASAYPPFCSPSPLHETP